MPAGRVLGWAPLSSGGDFDFAPASASSQATSLVVNHPGDKEDIRGPSSGSTVRAAKEAAPAPSGAGNWAPTPGALTPAPTPVTMRPDNSAETGK